MIILLRTTSLITVIALVVTSTARAHAQSPYVIGPNVRLTHADGGRIVQETVACADPRDARRILAAAIVEHGDTNTNVFMRSTDGGVTWREAVAVTPGVDPSCTFTSTGVVLAASVHDSLPGDVSYLDVRRSADGGATWTSAIVHDNMASLDRAYVTAGDGGVVFVHAYLQAPVGADGKRAPSVAVVYASRDTGRTFDRMAILPGTTFKTPWFFIANGVTTPRGTFVGLLAELDNTQRNMFRGRSDSASAPHTINGEVRVVRTRDGGKTMQSARIADAYYDWRVPQLSMASLAVDRSSGPHRGRLYAVWPDARYGRRTQILLSRSDDDGVTWSAPAVVSDSPDSASFGPNDFMPMVAVNRAGVVGLTWYDRRDNPDNLGYWPRFRASRDGGVTWLPSARVSTEANRIAATDRHLNGGDTAGLAADAAGRFHVVWIDNRTGSPQAFTATVEVRGAPR